ncbi:MAG: hypothetical protein ACFFCE_00485 [Promethearchaeota archaeon]
MYKTRNRKHLRRFTCFLGIIILSIPIFLIFLSSNNNIANDFYKNENLNKGDNDIIPKNSATWGWVNLTNYMINETRHYHNDIVPIEGRLYFKPNDTGYEGESVSLKVDGDILSSQYTNITNENGEFRFDYTIPNSSNIYTDHKFEAIVNTGKTVKYLNYLIINFKSNSTFANVLYNTSLPLLSGEQLSISGDLSYMNGSNIPSAIINYYWLDGTNILSQDSFNTDDFGSFTNTMIQVPNTFSNYLDLKLNFSDDPFVDYNESTISDISIFSNITCNLDIDSTPTEGQEFTLKGTLLSSTDPTIRISNREIKIIYNRTILNTTSDPIITESDGTFSATFQIPEGNGTASIQIKLENDLDLDLRTPLRYISVEASSSSASGSTGGAPPFLIFSMIFFPIIAIVAVALGIYGFYYYRKREKESRVVNLPLESRIENLKILKDSGRLEESISYLFNAIYMDLINAKYNRTRNINETIRDFAIISVKELKLTPSSIYPFIQKVEEIIYAKPFKILEQDFYTTCELFSPIYYQLTGYNFVLNF